MFVNAEKVGHAIYPIDRPPVTKKWNVKRQWSVEARDSDNKRGAYETPLYMVGCHRNVDDTAFRDFCRPKTIYDEVAIWTRKLIKNKTIDEIVMFMGGYGNNTYLYSDCLQMNVMFLHLSTQFRDSTTSRERSGSKC